MKNNNIKYEKTDDSFNVTYLFFNELIESLKHNLKPDFYLCNDFQSYRLDDVLVILNEVKRISKNYELSMIISDIVTWIIEDASYELVKIDEEGKRIIDCTLLSSHIQYLWKNDITIQNLLKLILSLHHEELLVDQEQNIEKCSFINGEYIISTGENEGFNIEPKELVYSTTIRGLEDKVIPCITHTVEPYEDAVRTVVFPYVYIESEIFRKMISRLLQKENDKQRQEESDNDIIEDVPIMKIFNPEIIKILIHLIS